MPLFELEEELVFPPVHQAEPDGLLAIGGDLSTERLLLAYRSGIFPWFEGEHILWWSPEPRFVLFPGELKVSKSMQRLITKNTFRFTIDQAFDEVISCCQAVSRKGQEGTWITDEVRLAYIRLYELGYAHSAEAWHEDELAGGLYGIRMGGVFFGESMFSRESNASKFAFIRYVHALMSEGIQLIDCQIYTEHLESLGARMIERDNFVKLLKNWIPS